MRQLAFRHREADSDRIHLDNREHRRAGRLRQAAHVHIDRAQATADAGADLVVTGGDSARLQRRLVGLQRTAQPIDLVARAIDHCLRDEIFCQQFLVALQRLFGVGQVGALAGQLRLRLGHVRFVAARVQRKQQLASLHLLPFAHVHRTHHVLDLRTHIDIVDGRHRTVGTQHDRHRLLPRQYGFHNLHRTAHLRRRVVETLAHAEKYAQRKDEEHDYNKGMPGFQAHGKNRNGMMNRR